MKKNKYFILIMLIIIIILSLYYFNSKSNINNNLEININEDIILNTSVIDSGVINDKNEDKYIYSFKNNIVSILSMENKNDNIIEINNVNNKLNINLIKGILFINNKKIFQCNIENCKMYNDLNGKYLIFVDRAKYEGFLFSKLLAYNTIKVFNLETYEYKIFPVLEYNGVKLDIKGISGFIK